MAQEKDDLADIQTGLNGSIKPVKSTFEKTKKHFSDEK